MSLFIHCYSKGHDALQETALRILSDILTTHTSILMPVPGAESGSVVPPAFQKPVLRVFAKALKPSSPPDVQTAAVTALSKLLLTNTLSPSGPAVPPAIKELNENSIDTLLQALVLSFFHPRTHDNLALRQALTYFLPVYCHSRVANAQHMRRIAVTVVRVVLATADDYYSLEAEEDSDGEIDEGAGEKEVKALMNNVTGMLAEWTDERRIVGLGVDPQQPPGTIGASAVVIKPAQSLHLALTRDALQRILGAGTSSAAPREERKCLLSLLAKLHIPAPPPVPASRASSRAPDGVEDRLSVRSGSPPAQESTEISASGAELLMQVKELLDQAIASNVAADAAGRNALVKAKNSVLKLLAVAQVDKARASKGREKEKDMPHIKEEMEADDDDDRAPSVDVSRRSSARNSPQAVGDGEDDDDDDDDGDDTVTAYRRDSGQTDTRSNAEAEVATDAESEAPEE
jgi:condensin complex subunit 3